MNAQQMMDQILASQSGAFALIYRPKSCGKNKLEILFGEPRRVNHLADIPLSPAKAQNGKAQHQTLVLVPHQQIGERGFIVKKDNSPLIVLEVSRQAEMDLDKAMNLLPNKSIELIEQGFDIKDDAYAKIIRTVLDEEIAKGEGSNFVIKRSFVANINNYSIHAALSLFYRLLNLEVGAYWVFLVHTEDRTFIGATPERHISLNKGVATMNPISGTYRYPSEGPDLSGILEFINDRKETDELYMVLDEELKMMSRICDQGGQVTGPFLREMSQLAHTEYYIKGKSCLDPRDILKKTMFAPTVTGSPLENACRVIAKYEPQGRGYYGGIVALIGRDSDGVSSLDSAILIRTADIKSSVEDQDARIEIGVGATLVRHSDVASEISETHAKAAGVLAALRSENDNNIDNKFNYAAPGVSKNTKVIGALMRRNANISDFWFSDPTARVKALPNLRGFRVLIIDAEDTFISMITHQFCAIGLEVDVVRFDNNYCLDNHDLIVLGPGPGDPRETSHPKIAHISSVIEYLLFRRIPFLAVCLSHQLLCRRLDLGLIRLEKPNQGIQRKINLFGVPKRVGFYNSYIAWSHTNILKCSSVGDVRISRDTVTGEVYALSGSHFSSVQFHIESVLTEDGVGIFNELLTQLLITKEKASI